MNISIITVLYIIRLLLRDLFYYLGNFTYEEKNRDFWIVLAVARLHSIV
jgi:hypothetical protein